MDTELVLPPAIVRLVLSFSSKEDIMECLDHPLCDQSLGVWYLAIHDKPTIIKHMPGVIVRLSAYGYLEVLQHLASEAEFKLTREDARADNNYALQRACANGRLDTAKWLVHRWALTAEDARARCSYALRHACENGHLAVAQWLTAIFDLTIEDARALDNYAFREACGNGHLSVVQWLVATFKLTIDDVQANNSAVLWSAGRARNYDIVQWLVSTFT